MTVPKRIGKISFGLISPQEFRKMSVVKIITADTYDDDGFPIEMGLMDPRLGVIDPGLRCRSCGAAPVSALATSATSTSSRRSSMSASPN